MTPCGLIVHRSIEVAEVTRVESLQHGPGQLHCSGGWAESLSGICSTALEPRLGIVKDDLKRQEHGDLYRSL